MTTKHGVDSHLDHKRARTDNVRAWDLEYDVFSPRSHLIIVKHGLSSQYQQKFENLNTLTEDDLHDVVVFTLTSIDSLHVADCVAVLSFHTGFFQSKASMYFHAHICLNLLTYTTLLEYPLPPLKKIDWDQIRPTRDWLPASDAGESRAQVYFRSVKNYFHKTKEAGVGYYRDDFERCTFNALQKRDFVVFEKCRIVYHENEPLLGFTLAPEDPLLEQPQSHLTYLLSAIRRFAASSADVNIFDRKTGAHVCVRLTNSWGEYVPDGDENFLKVHAYIRVLPVLFYRLNPDRDRWLDRCKHAHAVSKSFIILS